MSLLNWYEMIYMGDLSYTFIMQKHGYLWYFQGNGHQGKISGVYLIRVAYFDCRGQMTHIQYIPRNMHTVFALLCFVVVIHWLIFPYPSGLLHWHCGNLTIAPVPAKQPWWIWINTSCEFIMNDCITTTKQSTKKPCAYFLGYTVCACKQYKSTALPKRTKTIQNTHLYINNTHKTIV